MQGAGRPDPARGVLAGIKADLDRAKQSGGSYDPRGTGSAWSHAFLNQKPWHPGNFRNQIRKFDAEQQAEADKKAKEQALVEFNAEQESLKTMSYLSAEEQEKYRQRQSISFMYMKPPGLDAALAKEQQQEAKAVKDKPAAEQQAASDKPGHGKRPREPDAVLEQRAERAAALDRVREDPYAAMMAARAALTDSAGDSRFVLRHGGAGSPAHGGYTAEADNQQMLVDDPAQDEEGAKEALLASLSEKERRKVLKAIRKQREEHDKARQVAEAEAVLRAAGLDMSHLGKSGKKDKKKKKKKKAKGSKSKHSKDAKGREHGAESDSSSGSGSSQ